VGKTTRYENQEQQKPANIVEEKLKYVHRGETDASVQKDVLVNGTRKTCVVKTTRDGMEGIL